MITKTPKITRKSSRKPEFQALTPCLKALILALIELGIHIRRVKRSQQAIGFRMGKHRHCKKVSPREYVNFLIKKLTELGIIEHWGNYEDTHWYTVTDLWRDTFFKIQYEAKRIAFENASLDSLKSAPVEKLTLFLSFLVTSFLKRVKTPHKGKSPRRSSSYKRYFDSYFPQKFPDTTSYQLTSGAKQMDLLIIKYGVPFVPDIDLGKELNAFFWEECDLWECERYLFDGSNLSCKK
jgi:hypothetical protein